MSSWTKKRRFGLGRHFILSCLNDPSRACLDMVASKKEVELHVFWLPNSGDMHNVICFSFEQVLLLLKNIDLCCSLRFIEVTRD